MTMRWLLASLAVLVLMIISSSAYIRLALAGIGCADWPGCYGATPTSAPVLPADDDPLLVPRALHRVAASLAGVLVLAAVFGGWRRWRNEHKRIAAVLLLLVTLGLSWLGVVTPSPLPIVTLANLVGGFALLALTIRLLQPAGNGRGYAIALAGVGLIAVTVLQATSGGMLAARHAAAVCNTLPLCDAPLVSALPLLDPLRTLDETARPALPTLHLIHRALALVLVVAALLVVTSRVRSGATAGGTAMVVVLLVLWQFATGAWMALAPGMLPAMLHNGGAALLLAATALLAVRSPPLQEIRS